MRKVNVITTAVAMLVIAGVLYACNSAQSEEKKSPVPTEADLVRRGEYLVAAIGCDDCHSPKRMGAHGPEVIPELRFSGYPSNRPVQKPDAEAMKKGWMLFGPDLTSAVGPWGMSFAANISSDATGIGNWTEQHFFTAIRHGKAKGLENNRDLLPPMPWFNFKNLSDEDLRSIFAYLKSTPPVKNVVPAPKAPTEFK